MQNDTVPIKMNAAAILREGARVQREEDEVLRKLAGLEAGEKDDSEFLQWKEQMKQVWSVGGGGIEGRGERVVVEEETGCVGVGPALVYAMCRVCRCRLSAQAVCLVICRVECRECG